MPEDLLELDAEQVEQTDLTDDQQHVEDDAQQTDDTQTTEQQTDDTEKTPVTSLFQADGKKLDPQVSAALAKLKTENPDLGKLLARAVYRSAEVEREFPGGLVEARELRDKVEEWGGVGGIEQKLESAAEMDGLAKAYMAGDAAFVEDLVASSPEAFSALAPAVLNKFAELNADGFGAYLGRIVYGDMQRNDVPLLMMRLADTLGDNAKAIEAFKAVNGYLGGFKSLAEKALPAATPKAAPAGKQDDLSKREEALRSKEWSSERDGIQKAIVNEEYLKLLAGRKPDTEEKAAIKELFLSRSTAAADRLFPGWKEKAQRYIASGDKPGYLRYMKSIYTRVIPEAMASAVGFTMKGKKAPVATGGKKAPVPARKGAPVATDAAFKPVPAEPSTWDVDFSRTSQQMLRENRAILKDGKKVAWK